MRSVPRVEIVLTSEEISLVESIRPLTRGVVLTRANLDLPGPTIIGVSQGFERITGYREDDVRGYSPRLLQGPLTDRATLDRLRAVCTLGERFEGEAVNYTADGRAFLLHWCIDPIRSHDGAVTHFIAAQEDVTDQRAYARQWLKAETDRRSALNEVSQHMAAIAEAILVLEHTKRNFRSQQLGELRRRLLTVSNPSRAPGPNAVKPADEGS